MDLCYPGVKRSSSSLLIRLLDKQFILFHIHYLIMIGDLRRVSFIGVWTPICARNVDKNSPVKRRSDTTLITFHVYGQHVWMLAGIAPLLIHVIINKRIYSVQ